MRTLLFAAIFFVAHALVILAACASDLLAGLPAHRDWERQIVASLPGHSRTTIYGLTAVASAAAATLGTPLAFRFRFPFTLFRVGLVSLVSGLVSAVFLGQTVRVLLYVRYSPAVDLGMVGALAGVVGGICSLGALAAVMPGNRGG